MAGGDVREYRAPLVSESTDSAKLMGGKRRNGSATAAAAEATAAAAAAAAAASRREIRSRLDQAMAFQCKRRGCDFAHLRYPRSHGFCCNACRRGESVHTNNCSGRGQDVVFDHIWEAGAAGAQAEQCPAACSAVTSGQQHESGEGMRLPDGWKRGDQEPLDYVLWFVDR